MTRLFEIRSFALRSVAVFATALLANTLLALVVLQLGPSAHAKDSVRTLSMVSVVDFLPAGFVTDGSVSYQSEIQKSLDAVAQAGGKLEFPAITLLVQESGLNLASNTILEMAGTTFLLSKDCTKDGRVFLGKDVTNVRLNGGTVVGHNTVWKQGVNIRGVQFSGSCKNIRINGMTFLHLTSNGIGVFGTEEKKASDIWITDVTTEDCCNYYGDYQNKKMRGRAKGSKRTDQGGIAFYFVNNFIVRGCRIEKSRSDGTHFFKCTNGRIVNNTIRESNMGGFFLETCENIYASGNSIQDNGSRGVTIERRSRNCTFIGNLVSGSGREGIWAPGCQQMIFSNNLILKNGRKTNGSSERSLWNANIKINDDAADPKSTPATDYLVSNNIIETTKEQIAAIRIVVGSQGNVILENNMLLGENKRVQLAGAKRGDKKE